MNMGSDSVILVLVNSSSDQQSWGHLLQFQHCSDHSQHSVNLEGYIVSFIILICLMESWFLYMWSSAFGLLALQLGWCPSDDMHLPKIIRKIEYTCNVEA